MSFANDLVSAVKYVSNNLKEMAGKKKHKLGKVPIFIALVSLLTRDIERNRPCISRYVQINKNSRKVGNIPVQFVSFSEVMVSKAGRTLLWRH